ncbi:hypothetical protein PVK06_048163 [Gossypium arboreum]|uniref:Uncharacterized protein n=1 Tax=Gossypium arboreum TaxID=29729 RepID=A0ABR0MFN3_GOSAR|nr:hypothetical protein PVK06_048163 [Gossypium arboreum]
MKSVTLSHGSHQASDCLPSLSASSAISSSVTCLAPHLVAQETSAEDASLQAESPNNIASAPLKEKEAVGFAIGPEVQPPKKMVNINDSRGGGSKQKNIKNGLT